MFDYVLANGQELQLGGFQTSNEKDLASSEEKYLLKIQVLD